MKVVTAWEDGSSLLPRVVIGTAGLALVLFSIDVLAIAASGVLSGGLYHVWGYGSLGPLTRYAGLGVLAGLLYALPTLYRGEYHLQRMLEEADQIRRFVGHWLHAFVFLVLIGFLTKTSAEYSRGALAVYLVGGLGCAVVMRKLSTYAVQVARRGGFIAGRRVMLIGAESDIDRAITRICDPMSAMRVCGCLTVELDQAALRGVDWGARWTVPVPFAPTTSSSCPTASTASRWSRSRGSFWHCRLPSTSASATRLAASAMPGCRGSGRRRPSA